MALKQSPGSVYSPDGSLYVTLTDGNGNLATTGGSSGLTIGTTTITSGTDTRVLFNDGGVVGEDAGLSYNKTTNFLTIASGGLTLTSSTINKLTLTAPATAATLSIIDGTTITGPSATTTLPGLSLANTWTVNGALSAPGSNLNGTWITGGSATTTKPYVLIEPTGTTSTGWQTVGTAFGINAASTSSYLFDLQAAGVSKLSVSGLGQVVNALGSITTNQPFTISQTFNGGAVAFTGFAVNITDTSSATALVFDFKVGGSSYLKLNAKNGDVTNGTGGYIASSNFTGVNLILNDNASQIVIGASGDVRWARAAASVITLRNAAGTGDTRLNFGAATNAFASVGGNGSAVEIYDGSGTLSYYHWAGQGRVSTQFDKASNTTLADVTGLSASLKAGKTYTFSATLFVDADVAGGQKYAVACSSAPTSIVYQINALSNTSNTYVITSRQTSSGGSSGQAGSTGNFITLEGTVTANAACTLTIQFAQNVASGTSSVLVGSSLIVQEFS